MALLFHGCIVEYSDVEYKAAKMFKRKNVVMQRKSLFIIIS